MSEELLVREAKLRAEVFKNLPKYLEAIVKVARELDENAEVYLFGNVVNRKHLLSSDIDVLIATNKPPEEVLSAYGVRIAC